MSVIIRKVRTALQSEYQKAGGILVDDAIAQAAENLTAMSDQGLAEIDRALATIVRMTAQPDRRPSAAELRTLHALVNDMLACCAVVHIEGLVETLYAIGGMVDALLATEGWLDGALTPAVNLLRLVRGEAIDSKDLTTLVAGIEQCAQHVRAHSRLASSPPAPSVPAAERRVEAMHAP